jgi:hypothetical protein
MNDLGAGIQERHSIACECSDDVVRLRATQAGHVIVTGGCGTQRPTSSVSAAGDVVHVCAVIWLDDGINRGAGTIQSGLAVSGPQQVGNSEQGRPLRSTRARPSDLKPTGLALVSNRVVNRKSRVRSAS